MMMDQLLRRSTKYSSGVGSLHFTLSAGLFRRMWLDFLAVLRFLLLRR
jgi:hypothetical protein